MPPRRKATPASRGTTPATTVSSFTSPEATDSEPGNDPPALAPAVIVSPIRRRQRNAAPGIRSQNDVAIWDRTDEEIIEAARATWRSDAYQHFDISLRRDFNSDGSPHELLFVFTCKTHPTEHKPHFRPRKKTGEGTSNLQSGITQCFERRGENRPGDAREAQVTAIPYTEAAHRALIALRCAKNHRPFNSVLDEDYQAEVNMLRPGTKLPHPATVSRDIQAIYLDMSKHIRDYFEKRNNTIHLVMDGWTAPIVASFLGIVVVWYEKGIIHRAILEFIRLTQKHDGEYLANVTADCLNRFGLMELLHSVCMDNASNCDSMAKYLPDHIPIFRGTASRGRCFPHIINLIAKIFITFFFKQPKKKKVIKVSAGSRRQTGHPRNVPTGTIHTEEVIVINNGDSEVESDEDEAIEEEAAISAAAVEGDNGQAIHDNSVVKTLRDRAIQIMKDQGVVVEKEDLKMALQLFPRVAGLARRVHDSATLKEKFDRLVQDDDELQGSKRALDRRVSTRWNSDLTCLEAHVHFKNVIQQLTGVATNKLQAYRLSDEQWGLADDLIEVLMIFEGPTKLFSQSQVPLIVDAIPMLEAIEESMVAVRDDNDAELPNVIRVAAQAALLLIDKYSIFTNDCELYQIAIVMCPDRKLKWFKDHGRTAMQIKEIKKMVIKRWEESYYSVEDETPENPTPVTQPAKRKSKWVKNPPATSSRPMDHITTYLADPVLHSDIITDAGGYMMYWHQASIHRPCLSKMGSDFCSAPASSVDSERAFSMGRLEVNHLQHNMNSQTFKAQVAVGSWARTPLYPGFTEVTKIVERNMASKEVELVEET